MLAQKLCQLCGTFNCERFWKIPCATCVENLKKTRSMVFGSARTFTTSGFSGIRWDYPSIGSFSDLVSLVGQWHRNLELFAMVAWFIWYRHNKLWHNLKNQVFPPQKIFDAACNLLTEFQTKTPSIHKQPRPDFIEWKSPAPDEFKTWFFFQRFLFRRNPSA